MSERPEALREHAARHRERGNTRLAERYERRATEAEREAEIRAREVRLTIKVAGTSYRVTLNHNDEGKWYANAHGRGDVMPAAFVNGEPSRADCLAALKKALRERA